jgi:hypothetical protein
LTVDTLSMASSMGLSVNATVNGQTVKMLWHLLVFADSDESIIEWLWSARINPWIGE